KVTRKGGRKQRARLRSCAVISCSSLTESAGAAVVAQVRIVERGFHPIVKTDWTITANPLAQLLSQLLNCRIQTAHADRLCVTLRSRATPGAELFRFRFVL